MSNENVDDEIERPEPTIEPRAIVDQDGATIKALARIATMDWVECGSVAGMAEVMKKVALEALIEGIGEKDTWQVLGESEARRILGFGRGD